jgi:O-antigen ligase
MDEWVLANTIRIRIWAVIIGGLIFAIWIGQKTADNPLYIPAYLLCGVFFLILGLLPEDWFWIACVASIFFGGNFNFLPADLRAFEILAVVGVGRFILHHVVLRHEGLQSGPKFDLLLICGFMLIIMLHAFKNRFGMKIFGSAIWGGRPYVSVILSFFIYLIFQTMKIDIKKWRWLPVAVFIPALFDVFVGLVTHYVPSTIDLFYHFYSAVSISGIEGIDVTERIGALAGFGLPLAMYVLAYASLRRLFIPKMWLAGALVVLGLVLCVQGGYRSSVLNCALVIIAVSLRDFKFLAWIPILCFVLFLFGLAVLHTNQIITLPLQAQRALVFLPGKWDLEMIDNAESSNEFRFDVWQQWSEKYFVKEPFLGRGFGFDKSRLNDNGFEGLMPGDNGSYALTQNLHNGFLSSLDTIGIIGCIFFITWVMTTLARVALILLRRDTDRQNPALRWLCVYIFMWSISFFAGSLQLATFLPTQMVVTALFLRLWQEHENEYEQVRNRKAPITVPA